MCEHAYKYAQLTYGTHAYARYTTYNTTHIYTPLAPWPHAYTALAAADDRDLDARPDEHERERAADADCGVVLPDADGGLLLSDAERGGGGVLCGECEVGLCGEREVVLPAGV